MTFSHKMRFRLPIIKAPIIFLLTRATSAHPVHSGLHRARHCVQQFV